MLIQWEVRGASGGGFAPTDRGAAAAAPHPPLTLRFAST